MKFNHFETTINDVRVYVRDLRDPSLGGLVPKGARWSVAEYEKNTGILLQTESFYRTKFDALTDSNLIERRF